MKGKTASPEKSNTPKSSGSFTGSQENILKAVVIILGLLIVVALGALLYGIATGASEQIAGNGKDISYEVAVQAPEDYFVIDQAIVGGHLTITFENTHGDYIWRIYDLERGALLGTIKSAWQQESDGG